MLTESARIADEKLGDLPAMKDEHLVASQILSTFLTSSLASFERSISEFQSQTAKNLANSTSALHSKASDQLSKLVHETSDEADAFNVELTTRGPRDTKQVLDAVDAMFQLRRRQFRLLLNIGFKLLEWLLLGIMWGIWFVVVIFNICKKTVVGVGRIVRWLVVF